MEVVGVWYRGRPTCSWGDHGHRGKEQGFASKETRERDIENALEHSFTVEKADWLRDIFTHCERTFRGAMEGNPSVRFKPMTVAFESGAYISKLTLKRTTRKRLRCSQSVRQLSRIWINSRQPSRGGGKSGYGASKTM